MKGTVGIMNKYHKDYQELNSLLKEICRQIISFSEKMNEKVQKINTKPSNERPFSRTGFVCNEYHPAGAELYFDIVISDDENPVLRFGLGLEKPKEEEVSQFYNLAIQFNVSLGSVKELHNKNEDYSMEDFRELLLEEDTRVIDIALSDDSIYDNKAEKSTGKSYRLVIAKTKGEYSKNGGISYDDNYKEILDIETIKTKTQTILDEHLSLV